MSAPGTHRRPRIARAGFRPMMDAFENRQLLTTVTPFLQGTVFNDANSNGTLDKGEAPLAGATINLYAANSTTPLATTTSGADGGYVFNSGNVAGGLTVGATYKLVESAAGYSNTGAQALSQVDTASVTAANAIQVTVVDPNKVVATFTSPVSYAGGYDRISYTLNGAADTVVPTQLNFTLGGDPNVNTAAFTSLCVGVNDRLGFNSPFATVIDPQSALPNGGQIAYLYNHYGTGVLPGSTTLPAAAQGLATKNVAAGLQVAVWELEYGNSFAVTGYDPNYTSAQDYADIQTAATAFLNEAAGKSEKVAVLDASLTGSLPAAGAAGQSVLAAMSYNFGDKAIPLGSLSGVVYADANNDGTRQATEAGIAGIAVSLYNTSGATSQLVTNGTTDSNGNYSFPNLAPGTYAVVEGATPGYLPDATNTGTLAGIAVTAGTNTPNNNFGEVVPGSIAGTVYADANNNGTKDAGEKGIAGVPVTLTQTVNGKTTAVATMTTDSNGNYSFPNLAPGTYAVVEGAVPGYLPDATNTGSIANIAVTQGSTSANNNFGEVVPGSIAGVVYADKTGDGLSGDDTALPGVTVQLLNSAGTVVATMTSGKDGSYSFTNLAPGTYTVKELVPTGYVQTGPSSLIYTVPLTYGQNVAGDNFDNYQLATSACPISGISYTDVGPCGVSTFCGLGGNTNQGDQVTVNFTVGGTSPVTVTFVTYTASSNFDLTKQSIFSVDTETLAPGPHSLTVTIPDSYYQIDFVCGSAIANFNPAANITYHGEGRFIDADHGGSEAAPASFASLSGSVFVDNNYDGNFGAGDVGLGGVTIKLTGKDANGQAVALTRLTGKDGTYSFAGLQPGTYTVSEATPTGYFTTKDSVGTAGGTLANPRADLISAISLAGGTAATQYNFGEQAVGNPLGCNQTASTCFWNSCSGQNLIKSLNGSASSTSLGTWLAAEFPNSLSCLKGQTNSQIAADFQWAYNQQGRSSELAEGLATALACYATDANLAGGTYAACYGFKVTAAGAGAATINIGNSLACYGGPTGTVTLLQLLQFADGTAGTCDSWLQYRLACLFDSINGCGCC